MFQRSILFSQSHQNQEDRHAQLYVSLWSQLVGDSRVLALPAANYLYTNTYKLFFAPFCMYAYEWTEALLRYMLGFQSWSHCDIIFIIKTPIIYRVRLKKLKLLENELTMYIKLTLFFTYKFNLNKERLTNMTAEIENMIDEIHNFLQIRDIDNIFEPSLFSNTQVRYSLDQKK